MPSDQPAIVGKVHRRFDVVVVLGAAPLPSGAPSPAMQRRVAHGVDAFERCGAEALLVTGGPPGRDPTEAALMCELAITAGVARDRIVVEPKARSTFENATRSAAIMRTRCWTTALVVTDVIHLPRAMLAFRVAGIRARGRGVRRGWRTSPFRSLWHYVAYEIAAILWYIALILARRQPR